MNELMIIVAWMFGELERNLTHYELLNLCSEVPEPKPDFVILLMGLKDGGNHMNAARDLAIFDFRYDANADLKEIFPDG